MASASGSMVQPVSSGGYGRRSGPFGGLQGKEFAASCPPDIQRHTRIIAVCGIPDVMAAPHMDGWFFSDFFLFYQMLRSRPELPNQLWLSCCSPSDLIRKHKRYVHGPPSGIAGERRVVMDEKLLPEDEMKAGFCVIKPKYLLERFLGTLKDEIKEAARTKRPVLVLIFGHGEKETSGISIGCVEGGKEKLTDERLSAVLQKQVQTTMILTSCFSGGWIMKPNFNENFDVKPTFNHSFLTAAGFDNESISWSVSQSVGRQAGGSVFATCLFNSIITASDRMEGAYNENSEGILTRIRDPQVIDESTRTMAALTQQIVYEFKARCGTIWDEHKFSFAVQDDLWAKACGERTGLPLMNYKERWENLPEAPVGEEVYPAGGPLAGSIRSRSHGAMYNLVRAKAIRYMKSNPGPDNVGANTNCHYYFYSLVEGAELAFEDLYRANGILDFRQGQMAIAETYCEKLGVGLPEGRRADQFDQNEWVHAYYRDKNARSPERSKVAEDFLKRFNTIKSWVMRLDLFDSPRYEDQGLDYSKTWIYLAARLAESQMSTEQIHEKLKQLVQYRLRDAQRTARTAEGKAILDTPEIKTLRERLYGQVGKLKHRMRSISPHKRTPRNSITSWEGQEH